MPTISVSVLRRTLQLDSLSGVLMAAGHLLATEVLTSLLGLPAAILHLSAAIALGAAVLAGTLSRQNTPSSQGVRILVIGNTAWVLASIWLVWAAPFPMTQAGQLWVLIQAAAVAVLACVEALGARTMLNPPALHTPRA